MNNWIEISEPNLAENFTILQAAAGSATEVLAVVKANAYGHGAALCAPVLARAGARWLGVTCASEGVQVRDALNQAGLLAPEILIMCGFLPEDVPLFALHRLTPVLWTGDQIQWLSGSPALQVHVEVDTGMGRQGVLPGPDLDALLVQLAASQHTLDGLFTHFSSSEVAASPITQAQQRRFESAVAQLGTFAVKPSWIHAGNSSALDNPPLPATWLVELAATVSARALIRTGLALYGLCLPIEQTSDVLTLCHVRPALQPVLTWKARILSVRALAAGDTVGYNATFIASAAMQIALLPVGYADGLRRELSSSSTLAHLGGWAMIRGHRAPILGRISMNLTVVDITAIPDADLIQPGDEAILLGPGISAEDHAGLAETIPYEILCGIHPCG